VFSSCFKVKKNIDIQDMSPLSLCFKNIEIYLKIITEINLFYIIIFIFFTKHVSISFIFIISILEY